MTAPAPQRRAFALPLVIGVIVIASILIAAVLARHTGQSLLTQRHIDRYTEHHAFKGLEEAVTAWVNNTGTVRDALSEDGHAFDIQMPDGQTLEVYFEDAQGTALGRFSGLADQDLDDAAATVDNLRKTAGNRAPEMLRKEGPLAVSVASAPPEVLHAVALTLVSPVHASALADELQRMQENWDVTPDSLNAALDAANVPPEDRARASRLLTTEPALYRVRVEAWVPGGHEPAVTYQGLCLTGGARGAARTGATVTRNSAFLSWERTATETEPRTMRR